MAKKERNGFIVYHEMAEVVKALNDNQCATLFKALINFSIDGTVIEMDDITKIIFTIYKSKIECDKERYENKCKQMQANVSKRYESIQMNTNECESIQMQPTKLKETKLKETKLNIKEKEEKEKSSAFFESFIELYEIKPDISSLTTVRDLDFKKVLKAWGESKWLKTEIKSLRWVVNNYQKIIAGEYKDKATYKAKEEEPKEESEYEKKRKKNLEIIKKSSHEWGFDSGVACFLGLDLDYIKEGDLPIPIEQYKRETA